MSGAATRGAIDAEAWIDFEADDDGDVTLRGNAAGLTELGQLLLRCADHSAVGEESRRTARESSLRHLSLGRTSGLALASVDLLAEPPPPELERTWWRDRLSLVGSSLVVVVVGMIFLGGALFWSGLADCK